MIEHIWSVLCSRAVIDVETNNVSIQDVIEQITVNSAPVADGFLPFPLEIVTLWNRKEITNQIEAIERVQFITPSGKATVISEGKIDLTQAERFRHRVKLPGLPLSESGRYYFKVESKTGDDSWKEVASIPLSVTFQAQN
jgi:hypothetical protein